MRWLAAHTWLLALLPIVAVLVCSYYTGHPLHLWEDTEADYIGRDTVLCVHILSEGQERAKTLRYTAQEEGGSKILLYLYKDSLSFPVIGDVLMVRTRVERGGRLGDFDYGRYLRLQGIVGSGFASRNHWQVVGHQPVRGVRAVAERAQHALYARYQTIGVHGKEAGIVGALTLGYREELDRRVQESFSAAGAMHILAVSGLHTGVVWGVIIGALTLFGRKRPLYEQRKQRFALSGIALIALWGYAFLTGLSPSVMRSALMVSLFEIGVLLRRPLSGINGLCAAAVIILLLNPRSLWSVSFQLSFAAMAGLMLITTALYKRVALHGRVLSYIGGLILASIGAQIGTAPLTLYYFGQVSNYFVLTNLVVIPLTYILLVLGIAALAMSWCIVGDWLGTALQWATWGLRQYVEWIESLPHAVLRLPISAPSVGMLYGAIACGILMMRGDKVHWGWLGGVIACALGVIGIELRV